MLTPNDIQKKALRQYKDFLRAVLRREQFFPLYIKGNKGKASTPLEGLFPQLRRLLEGAKDKIGHGYTVTLKTVNTRHAGNISMPDEIFFANVEDYLKFIDKEKEFLQFRKAVQLTHRQVPTLITWMQEHVNKILPHLTIWEELLKVVLFFQKNPQPQQYSRALAIDIPATFIEDNSSILELLLSATLNTNQPAKTGSFTERFGLKAIAVKPLVRALSSSVFPDLPSSIEELALAISTYNNLTINASTVFIIQDEINFLRFPNFPEGLAIYGHSDTLASLSQLNCLQDKNIYFWGDIAITGFGYLADLRKFFPQTKAFLMDKSTLETYEHLAIKSKTNPSEIPLLEPEEYELVIHLKEKEIELEQKHIRQDYLENIVKKALI